MYYYYFYCLLFLRVLYIVSLDEVDSLLTDFTSSVVSSSSSHTILELCQRKPLIDVLSTDGTIPGNTLVGNISSS